MADAQDWLANLEHGLSSWLDDWLEQNPRQRELLGEEEVAEAGAHQRRSRHEACQLRQVLLEQAREIQRWEQRYTRVATMDTQPRSGDLARLCRNHLDRCHGDGSVMWQHLEHLGQVLADSQVNVNPAPRQWQVTQAPATLMDAWRRFELDMELEQLKRRGRQRA